MEKLLTREQVATLLQKPLSWLRYAERLKLIPTFRVGQQVRYRESDLERWLARNRVPARGNPKAAVEARTTTPERAE